MQTRGPLTPKWYDRLPDLGPVYKPGAGGGCAWCPAASGFSSRAEGSSGNLRVLNRPRALPAGVCVRCHGTHTGTGSPRDQAGTVK